LLYVFGFWFFEGIVIIRQPPLIHVSNT